MLYRNEITIPDDIKASDKVTLVKGDVLNVDDIKTLIDGVDGVSVILGTRNSLQPTTDLSNGMQNIITAMNAKNIKKISVCLSAFLFYPIEKVPAIFKDLNSDHQRMYDALKASNLEYRAIFPPHIADEPKGKFTTEYDSSPGRAISKHDLGAFLIDCLEQEEHSRKTIGLATVKS